MSSCEGTTEQPPIPEDPVRLTAEHLGLAVAIVAGTVSVGALAVQMTTHIELLLRGSYSVLAALIVVGVVVHYGGRVLRELTAVKALLIEVRRLLRQGPVAPEAEAALQRIGLKLLRGGREIS